MNINSINDDNFDRTGFLITVQSWLSKYAKLYEGLGAFAGVGLGLQAFRDAYGMLKTFNQHFAYEPPAVKKDWGLYAETADVTFDYLDVGDLFVLVGGDKRLCFKSGRDSIHFLSASRYDFTFVNRSQTKVRRVQVIGYPD